MGRKPSEIIVNLKSPTRLENDMRYALQSAAHRGLSYEEAAAEVAKKHIEKAMKETAMIAIDKQVWSNSMQEKWLKDNGITE